MWDPGSLARDRTHVPYIGRQTQLLDHQGSPWKLVPYYCGRLTSLVFQCLAIIQAECPASPSIDTRCAGNLCTVLSFQSDIRKRGWSQRACASHWIGSAQSPSKNTKLRSHQEGTRLLIYPPHSQHWMCAKLVGECALTPFPWGQRVSHASWAFALLSPWITLFYFWKFYLKNFKNYLAVQGLRFGIRDLWSLSVWHGGSSSLTRDPAWAPAWGVQCLSRWASGEVPFVWESYAAVLCLFLLTCGDALIKTCASPSPHSLFSFPVLFFSITAIWLVVCLFPHAGPFSPPRKRQNPESSGSAVFHASISSVQNSAWHTVCVPN